jgi:c(7)-type cytochrome triheme protein
MTKGNTGFWGLQLLMIAVCSFLLVGQGEAAPKKSYEYGNVTMKQFVKKGVKDSVVFRHWIHREKHSCRLCHVDIEFSMGVNETGLSEDDNQDGRYCGVCHDGKEAFSIKKCENCHIKNSKDAKDKAKVAKKKFFELRKKLPRSRYGNKIDWTKADEEGLIKPKDFIKGLSFEKKKMMVNLRNEPRTPKLPGLPEIIFSHTKHVVWNGCGMCHPDTFALETGKTAMTMEEIIEGKFCGECHGSVAFPLNDCSRCHSKPVSLK